MTYIVYPYSVFKLLLILSPHNPYVVGGGVRDALLNRATNDLDLVTADSLDNFLPTLEAITKKTYVTPCYQSVMFSFEDYKITLTRLRQDTKPLGRQADVTFVKTLQEDVWRRDFTMNALYADNQGNIIDYVGGQTDLDLKIVRFIGDPAVRIKEDVLRILRYVRFCSLFDTPMDQSVLNISRTHMNDLLLLPKGRIQYEIKQTLKLPFGKRNWSQFCQYCGIIF